MTDHMLLGGPPGGTDMAALERLTHEGPVAFALYDRDLRYLRVSAALARLNRLPVEAHLGRRPSELLPPRLARDIEETLERVFARGLAHTESDLVVVVPEWHETRHHESHWLPVRDAKDLVTAVLVVVEDVTEHRRREEQLRSSQWRAARLQVMTARLAGALTVAEVEAAVAELGASIGARTSELTLVDEPALAFPWPNAPLRAGPLPGRPLPPAWPPCVADAVRRGVAVYSPDPLAAQDPAAQDLAAPAPTLTPASAAAPPRPAVPAAPVVPPARDAADARERADTGADAAATAWAVIPLAGSAASLGALRFGFAGPRDWEPDERVFLEAFAGQCALAVERSVLYEREHRTAVALQRSLLPERLPAVRGVEFAHRYLPGAPGFEVGGDWYDVFQLLDGRVAVVVGDVIGKGLTAAAGMGRVRAALRALAFTDPEPTAVLTGLDRLFTATEDDESLTTLIYGVVDPLTGMVDLADAGHLPAVIVSADGKARLADMGPPATPLGLAEERTKQTFRLEPGDILLGFSDGLVENRSRGIDEGLREVLDVARGPARGLDALLGDIVGRLLSGQDRDDDVTLLGVRIAGHP